MMIDWIELTEEAWDSVKEAARTTINKDGSGKEPSDEWKKKILIAEHSPIRLFTVGWKWKDLKSWVSVHFVRHHEGINHFVSTQRTDRTGVNRDDLPQSSLVTHQCNANAQALINISRKRLCNQASKETREAWRELIDSVKEYEPILTSVCVPECVYRGGCTERFNPCGFWEKISADWTKEQISDVEERYRLYNEWLDSRRKDGDTNES